MDLGIRGRVALVTASSKGLGLGAARALADEGCHVVICARHEEALAAASADLQARGVEVVAALADVTEPDAPARLVAAAQERFGRLDIVVANAGGPPQGRALDLDDDAFLTALQANFLTSVRLARAALPALQAGGWGRICCIASASVKQPIPTLAASNTARTALWAWAKTAAADVADRNITVNLACPGLHATDRVRQLGAGGDARLGDPDDFGRAVAFLCSEPAGFVNGTVLMVDGGASTGLV